MSSLMAVTIALPTIRQTVLPTPTGLTPSLSLGSTKQEQILLAVEAKSHRSADADLNDVHMHFQAAMSSPDGPTAPSIRTVQAVLQISCLSILINKMGWGSIKGEFRVMIEAHFGGCFGGCYFRRILQTISGGVLELLNAI